MQLTLVAGRQHLSETAETSMQFASSIRLCYQYYSVLRLTVFQQTLLLVRKTYSLGNLYWELHRRDKWYTSKLYYSLYRHRKTCTINTS